MAGMTPGTGSAIDTNRLEHCHGEGNLKKADPFYCNRPGVVASGLSDRFGGNT